MRALVCALASLAASTGCSGPHCGMGTVTAIPAGRYYLGCERGACRAEIETDAFAISTTPVAHQAYEACVEAGQCAPQRSPYRDDPWQLAAVSRADAIGYCTWIGAELPSANEWMSAAAGRDGRDYPWGRDWRDDSRARSGGPDGPLGYKYARACTRPDLVSFAGLFDVTSYAEHVRDGDRIVVGRSTDPGGYPSDYRISSTHLNERLYLATFRCVRRPSAAVPRSAR